MRSFFPSKVYTCRKTNGERENDGDDGNNDSDNNDNDNDSDEDNKNNSNNIFNTRGGGRTVTEGES